MSHLPGFAAICIAVLLFGPALKVRFLLPDIFVYFLPTGTFLLLLAISMLAKRSFLYRRISLSTLFLLPLIPCYFAWFGDTSQLSLFLSVAINCVIGVVIVIYPWDSKSLDKFLLFCALLGTAVAVSLLLNVGTYEALENATEIERKKSLSIASAIGIACIASLYLITNRFSFLYAAFFVINWLALAASRGRGAVLVCAAITVLYLLILYFSKISTLSRLKKTALIFGAVSISPLVISKLFALSSGKWNRLLFDFDSEVNEGGRGQVMGAALKQIQNSPIFGNGLGQYAFDSGHPHNIILQYGVDSGLVGIGFLLTFFCIIAVKSVTSINRSGRELSNLSLAIGALFVFIIGNYLKSGDAYLGRDWFILSAISLAAYLVCIRATYNSSRFEEIEALAKQ